MTAHSPYRLERRGGMDLIVADGVPHDDVELVFTTRRSGTSFAANELNLSRGTGDDDANVYANRNLLFTALGEPDGAPVILRQVHGDRIVCPDDLSVHEFNRLHEQADGLLTRSQGKWLSVSIGDCVPVCLYDQRQSTLALLHSGWRSTARRITARAVEKLVVSGSRQKDIQVVIGPGIGAAVYQVDLPVIDAFTGDGWSGEELLDRNENHAWLNLHRAIRHTAESSGIPEKNITSLPLCTWLLPSQFFSHRRDGLPGGRMMALARIRPG